MRSKCNRNVVFGAVGIWDESEDEEKLILFHYICGLKNLYKCLMGRFFVI